MINDKAIILLLNGHKNHITVIIYYINEYYILSSDF